ncbi:MAG TPA: carbon starvation CstA family protein [Desulfatiglandales bacterium]|nr:carbon starvation CstA family protein [Desulfatiglandales bacterium]
MIVSVVLVSILIFILGYLFYSRFVAREFQLDDNAVTPAIQVNDGVDYVPARPALLIGQHFSAIAAAGPIVGPVLAAIWFGWLPAVLWIILGAIFIGGVHDFSSMIASVRHKASSIAEIVKENMSPTSHMLFLIFIWLCLVYVIIAFTDITAQTFKTVTDNTAFGPAVAASSILYLMAGLMMGVLLYKFRLNLTVATIIFVPVVLFIVWVGPRLPEPLLSLLSDIPVKQWDVFLLVYCFFASIIPMWLLLQPRGYLGGWFLYLVIIIGLIGAIFGGFGIEYPAINLDGFRSSLNAKLLFPILFITVACGACSGFHGIVSSGTTSKQIRKESDTLIVGYGAMLMEGLVAVLAVATVMMLPVGSPMLKNDPNIVYANGIARYMGLMGIGFNVAFPFALLAFSTFVYDTLDVSTRLGRYIFQEIFGIRSRIGAAFATLATLLLPLIFMMSTKEKSYLVAWPIFGTSNQLLASLTLLAISVWMKKTGKNALIAIVPAIFMLVMTLWALVLQIIPFIKTFGQAVSPDVIISGIFGIILLILSIWLVIESIRTLAFARKA